MKKHAVWLLPIITLIIGFYAGSMNRRLGSEKTNLVVVNDKAVIIKEDPLFVFDTPPGYEIATTVDSAVLWKEGRPKPVGDTDAQSDLSVWVRKADIDWFSVCIRESKVSEVFVC
jgi:hypothetical protein